MTEPHQHEAEYERSKGLDLDFPQPSMVPETEAERAARQPLFNKRKMIVWAVATFAVWISVSYIIPIAFETAKQSIKLSLEEASKPGMNPEVRTVELPNGEKIVITRHDHTITINTGSKGATSPAAATPAKPAQPPQPATPAPAAKK